MRRFLQQSRGAQKIMARSKVRLPDNWLERAIRFVSPTWSYRREAARFASAYAFSGYRGAKTGRPHERWLPGGGSADQDILGDLPRLRQRSRDLNRNNAIAAGATNVTVSNTVGSGIKPQSQINAERLGIKPEHALELQLQAERAYKNWKPHADSTNRLDFDEIQSIVQRQILENGEHFLLPLMIADRRPYSLALELVEADRVGTPPMMEATRRSKTRSGIELGERSQPVAYHIKKQHPGDYTVSGQYKTNDYARIPAWNEMGRRNVFHLFHQTRPGQSRGVPWFAPAMTVFKDMGEYLETELVSARIAACYSVFVTTPNPYPMRVNASAGNTDSEGKPVEYMEPGIVKYLAPGEDIKGYSPNRPGTTFDSFMERILRAIGVALDLPYELLAKDFSKTNYSSARAALLEARRFFQIRQQWLAIHLCQPVWEMVLEEAWLRGEFDAPDFLENRREYTATRWIPNGWQWVDPVKEAKGNETSLKNNMTTLSSILASRGEDLDETLETRAQELRKMNELEKKYHVTFDPERAAGAAEN